MEREKPRMSDRIKAFLKGVAVVAAAVVVADIALFNIGYFMITSGV
jgi:hypothetical protein